MHIELRSLKNLGSTIQKTKSWQKTAQCYVKVKIQKCYEMYMICSHLTPSIFFSQSNHALAGSSGTLAVFLPAFYCCRQTVTRRALEFALVQLKKNGTRHN